MKSAVILGAGQMGKRLAMLLNKNGVKLLAYGDNDPNRYGMQSAIPILSVEDALAYVPELVYIGVASLARSQSLIAQTRAIGYRGTVIPLCDIAAQFDLRAAMLQTLVPRLNEVEGDIAELGVYQGAFAWQMNLLFPKRQLHLFDTFHGFNENDIASELVPLQTKGKVDFTDTSATSVLSRMPHPEQVVLHVGYFPDTARALDCRFALVSIDADLYAPTLAALHYFLPRMNRGGILLLHDYDNPRFPGVAHAVRDYELKNGRLLLLPLPDLHGTAVIIVQS